MFERRQTVVMYSLSAHQHISACRPDCADSSCGNCQSNVEMFTKCVVAGNVFICL